MVQQGNRRIPDNGNLNVAGTSTVIPDTVKGHHVSVLGTNCREAAILELVVIFYIQIHPCQSKPCSSEQSDVHSSVIAYDYEIDAVLRHVMYPF